MTTILNGSTIIQNRTGKTIDSYTGNGNNVSGSSTTLVRSAEITIAVLSVTETNYACNIPTDCEVGDIIEIYSSGSGWFYLPVGNTLVSGPDRGGFDLGIILRKISSNVWGKIS